MFNVNWLGDVLFSTAVIRNIRYNYPESFIACIVPPRCRAILEGNPSLNEVIIFDESGQHRSALGKLKFILLLRKKRFDTVFLLHRSLTRALLVWLAGIPERIGYYTGKRAWLLTKRIMPPPRDSLHRIEYYLGVIEGAGLTVKDKFTEFFPGNEDAAAVSNFLEAHGIRKGDFVVGINPGGNWHPKRWQKEYFALLADGVIKECAAKIVITGSKEDLALAAQIAALMHQKPVGYCGEFDLKQLGALCRRLDIFITADTGPLHIANAAGAKQIIALFGPTHQALTGPYPAGEAIVIQKNTGCKIPCYVSDCADNRCMKAIMPQDVLAHVKRLIRRER